MAKAKRRVISHYDFVRDLGRGALGEDIAEIFLQREFGVIADNVSERNPDFDLLINHLDPALSRKPRVVPKKLLRKIFKDSFGIVNRDEITVEVKFDEAAARYGNLFIEVFFDIRCGSPGALFKCKADLFVWIVPAKKKFMIYVLKRPELLAWVFQYMFDNKNKISYKVPNISPYARGIPVPVKAVAASPACVGTFEFNL